ncbi:MAG: carboxypeptidase regulatory-like domain-containing protein [Acidobacteria bacterium]|nr:carboxypeptidase regulatory-like domain-containing protein [Acidobacteriota bacterium]
MLRGLISMANATGGVVPGAAVTITNTRTGAKSDTKSDSVLKFELLGMNRMGEITMSMPAADAGVQYYRTREHFVAVGEKR